MTRISGPPLPTTLDARRLIAECDRDVLLHTAVTLLTFTGIRASELTALVVRDYAPAARTLAVGPLRQPRAITIAPSAARALDRYLDGEETEPGESLLVGLRREWVYPLLRDAADRAGVPIGVHDLRRAAVAAVVEAGRPAREIATYFGTSYTLTAKDLAPLQEGWDHEVAIILEAAFTPGA